MTQRGLLGTAVFSALLVTAACGPSREERIAAQRETIDEYCVDCHNDLEQRADLSLESLELASIDAHRAKWERVVRKLRAGMMPPADGGPRPDPETYEALSSFVENELDRTHELVVPPPGLHRLNRVEYANAVNDLLAVEIDPGKHLPPDDSSNGFDNQAGTLGLSPALLEAYLRTAGKISRLALGTATTPTQAVYRVADDKTQNYRLEGLPFGTRGGIRFEHHFPASGEYNLRIFSVNLGNMGNFRPFGDIDGEQLIVLVDGERVGTFDWDAEFAGGSEGQLQTLDVRVAVSAGPHEVGVTFLATNYAPVLDMNKKFERSTIETGGLPGFTFYPHVGRVRIDGPYDAARPESSPSREKIFVCHPDRGAEQNECARRIVERLARRAYRGQAEPADIDTLMTFYEKRVTAGEGFEAGIEAAIQRLLTDPKFLFRTEKAPKDVSPGEVYEISDLELASRLSFFLWSSLPDEALLSVAEQGRLSEPDVLREQVSRMLADPRSKAFTKNFAGQWLGLRNLEGHQPVVDLFPDFDDNLREAFRRETELLFDALIRENRSVIELLTADFTFVNGRLAKHYGIEGVKGSRFRRVELGPDHDARRGLIGNGSFLTVSSQPVRTSPVIRGYWVLQNLLGMTPPPPPPDVPELEASEDEGAAGDEPTLREQLEAHRADPACAGCHKLMDPIGFALEPFDATGKYRTQDNGKPIDPTGVMYDGTPIEGPADLREFLLKYKKRYVRNVAEKLLTYALGRGVEHYDMPVVRDIAEQAAEHDYRFQELVLAVVESEPFRKNARSESSEQVASAESTSESGANGATPPREIGSAASTEG